MRNWILLLVALGLILNSCNDTIPVGTDILPGSDIPGNFFTDTTTIYSWTVAEDSLRSDKLFTSNLGYTSDPVFGKTDASLLMGFRIPSSIINPALNDTVGGYYLDSVVLALMVNGIYGDSTLPFGVSVYKLPSALNTSQVYHSNVNFPQNMTEVGSMDGYVPSLASTYDEDTTHTNLAAQMRIKLDPFFGQSLLNILNTDLIESNDLFHLFLPGLVVETNETPGAMISLDMLTNATTTTTRTALEDSRLHLYFKNGNDESLKIIFPATVLDLGVNKFDHDYSSSNVETALASVSDQGDAVNYIQGLASQTRIEFPYIDEFDANTAIIKAELVVTQLADGSEDIFIPPNRLFALKINENGLNENISDFSSFTSTHFNGFKEEVILESGEMVAQYRINISDYLQRVIFGQEPNDGMYIAVYPEQDIEVTSLNTSLLLPNRIVIGGGTNTEDDYRIRLDLTYSLLD